MIWHKIDPKLPDLANAFDGNAVAHYLAQNVSKQALPAQTGEQAGVGFRRQSIEYVPATRCTTTYLVSDDQGSEPTIGVAEVNTAGVEYRRFTDDARLPGLAAASDINAVQQRFQAEEKEWGLLNAVQPVRYKPGSRCTLRYQMQTDQGSAYCFGKLLAEDAEQIAAAVSSLYQAGQQNPALPRIARPLFYQPVLQMLVQAAVPGAELHDAAFDARNNFDVRTDWMWAVGRAVAALHSATDVAGPQKTIAGDLVDLDEYRPALSHLNPSLAGRFHAATEALGKAAATEHELPPVVSHGALRTDQFLLSDGQLALIDLDSICWSSPARDLGNFLAYLTWKALRQPEHAVFIEYAQNAFMDGYETAAALPDANWVAHYQAASILKIIGRRYTGLTYREWPLTEQLLDMAIRMINF